MASKSMLAAVSIAPAEETDATTRPVVVAVDVDDEE